MRKILPFLILMLIVTSLPGCKSVFRGRWENFNAYYNTFYNAQKHYQAGLVKVENAAVTINPEQPLRIHPTPNNSGDKEFEDAILKGADVLRDFSGSKWVDDALLLIGKSYFYQGKYYSADQKFQELMAATKSNDLIQEAVIWRGRYFLETEQIQEGIDYIRARLADEDIRWRRSDEAEARLILAQLFVEDEQWEPAFTELTEGLEHASGRKLNANAWFLLGQISERLGKEEEAIHAFSRVRRYNPEYTMVYHAQRKQAEISRAAGKPDQALKLFSDMSRDDKNFDELSELNYEIARSYQSLGDYNRAERFYHDVLRYTIKTPTPETKAKTYYGIAEIYLEAYDDYFMAATYFDSAASSGRDLTRLPEWFDAAEKSLTYNNYRQLRTQAYETDSLLWLSTLDEAAFDSVLTIVRQQKLEEMREERRRQMAASNTMINVSATQQGNTNNAGSATGFLNHKNQTQANQAKDAFRAIWGDRPLVDNWRRLDAVRLAREEGRDQVEETTSAVVNPEEEVTIDLSRIPFTEEDQHKSREAIASYLYEIGNVFFLQMDQPDSAEVNYRKVIERFPGFPVAAQAMYSLTQLYTVDGDSLAAQDWAERLAGAYPESVYRNLVAELFPHRITSQEMAMTREDSVRIGFNEHIRAVQDSLSVEAIEALREYSAVQFDAPAAPDAMFFAAQNYIELAKSDSTYIEREPVFRATELEWDLKAELFQAMKDSVAAIFTDTTYTPTFADSTLQASLADSVFKREQFPELYPYVGALWDSSRTVLKQWQVTFQSNSRADMVARLANSLALPQYVTVYLDSINRKPEPAPDSLLQIETMELAALTDTLGIYMALADTNGVLSDSLQTIVDSLLTRQIDVQARVEMWQAKVDSLAALSVPDSLAAALPDSLMSGLPAGIVPDSLVQHSIPPDSSAITPPETIPPVPPDTTAQTAPPDTTSAQAILPPVTEQEPPQQSGNTVDELSGPPITLPDGQRVYRCGELQTKLEPVKATADFLKELNIESMLEGTVKGTKLYYRVRIDETGKPTQVEILETNGQDNAAIFLEAAIREALMFKPVIGTEGNAVLAECLFVIEL